MIPERIRLAGFLSYREPQEATFSDRTLWMLAGPNGSGKSAIFDAVTFALFGQHRGGKRQNARSLIHHDCDRLSVEFDFQLDDQLFRVRRTLARQGRSTRQVLVRTAETEAGSDEWTAIAQTDTERGFTQWVDSHVRFSYETFTTSVLLLQGQAENLLQSTPANRHRLLCQIVGLDKFEELADRASRQLQRSQGLLRASRQQAEQAATQAPDNETTLRQRASLIQQNTLLLQAEIEALKNRLETSNRWHKLDREIHQIEDQAQRNAQQLKAAQSAESQRQERLDCSTHVANLRQWLACINETDQFRRAITEAQTTLQSAETEFKDLEAKALDTQRAIEACRCKVERAASQEQLLARQQVELSWACASTTRYLQLHTKLKQTTALSKELHQQLVDKENLHKKAQRRSKECEQRLQAAEQAAQASTQKKLHTEAAVQHARDQLQRLRSVAGQQCCPYCKQPLDPRHQQSERQRLQDELVQFENSLTRAVQEQTDATKELETLRNDDDQLRDQLLSLRHQVQDCQTRRQQLESNARDLDEQCRHLRQELVENTGKGGGNARGQARDHNLTSEQQLVRMRREAREADEALDTLGRESRSQQDLLSNLIEQQRDLDKQRNIVVRQIESAREKLAWHKGQLAGHEKLQATSESAVPHLWRNLSRDHLTSLVHRMTAELDKQEAPEPDPVELKELERAAHLLAAQLKTYCEQRDQLATATPPASQLINRQLSLARETLAQTEAQAARLLTQLGAASERRQNRVRTQAALNAALRDCRLWKRIEQLLGRDGLQRTLLEHAESSIVQFANAMLDRLSNGQLYVEMSSRAHNSRRDRTVLDLIARSADDTAGWTEVAFLSGSQKFRIAVALSLAIGQLAAGAGRGAQTVIIDEGFGCLDADNRAVMIQELQNLRGHLKRILLVSHQDEFCSAFPDGYRCELINGATRLTPFHE